MAAAEQHRHAVARAAASVSAPSVHAQALAGALALGLLGTGCATRAAAVRAPDLTATAVVVTPRAEDDLPLAPRFERAREMLGEGKSADAARVFDGIVADPSAGELAPPSLFNAGLGWEASGDRERALLRFAEARGRFGATEAGRNASLREARLLAWLERWPELGEAADRGLARGDSADAERVEWLGAKALALVEAGDADAAQRPIDRAQSLIEALGLGQGGKLPVAVAEVELALGEVRRLRGERITFAPMPPNFADALERRCQSLLDAQSAYTDAMRSYDAHWAAMSGYRVGQMYQSLHRDVLAITPPASADTDEKRALFLGAMQLRYRVLLEKGLSMMAHTVALGERTGEASAWIDRAREALAGLTRSLAETRAALAKLPHGEAQLQQALDDLAAKAKK